uniref:KIAA0408 n=1 Tax=Leptobrachium leishanense TaxID=445787 RepID=A0A8C5MG31_9ANUR
MELRRQIENNERNWKVEKMELMERFDSERREWECQWKIMQKKIEELYQEVKLRRENKLNEEEIHLKGKTLPFSVPFSHGEPSEQSQTAKHIQQYNSINNIMDPSKRMLPNVCSVSSVEPMLKLEFPHHTAEPEKCFDHKMSKTDNDTLNDALREIAKVSEELCKYQEEIRKKSSCKKNVSVPSLGRAKETTNITSKTSKKILPTNQQFPGENKVTDALNIEKPCGKSGKRSEIVDLSLEDSSLPAWCFPWHLTDPLFSDMDNTESSVKSKPGHLSYFTENKDSTVSNSTNFMVNTNYDGLCHVNVLCDINGLEKDDVTTMLLGNKLATENVNQNSSAPYGGFQCSSNLHSDRISLGFSPLSFGSNYDHTIKNGKLAAKIDEFNRTVFKTGKGSTTFPEPTLASLQTEDEESSPYDCPNLMENEINTCSVTEENTPASVDNRHRGTIKSVKVTNHQSLTTGTHNTSSYRTMLQEHNWKPSNLSGRPRSADSRSNYRVVEKLLKSYENKFVSPLGSSQHSSSKLTQSDFLLTDGSSDALTQCLEMLQIEKTTKALQNDISILWQPGQESMSPKPPEVKIQ